MKSLLIASEEAPRLEIFCPMLNYVFKDMGLKTRLKITDLEIIPVQKMGKFKWEYEIKVKNTVLPFRRIIVKIITGSTSITDHNVYLLDNPSLFMRYSPLYCFEETKSTFKDSNNTFVGQRAIKFIEVARRFPNAKRVMLYSVSFDVNDIGVDTASYKDLTLLKTLGVDIVTLHKGSLLGIQVPKVCSIRELLEMYPYQEIDNMVRFCLMQTKEDISIQAKLDKGEKEGKGKISHDPNVGKVILVAAVLRHLKYKGKINVVSHGVEYLSPSANTKFTNNADFLGIHLDGVYEPKKLSTIKGDFCYPAEGEKNVSILLEQIAIKSNFQVLFVNHASGELGYIEIGGVKIKVPKSMRRPDLALFDKDSNTLFLIEAENFKNYKKGIEQLKTFKNFEKVLVEKLNIPTLKVVSGIALHGGQKDSKQKVLVHLTEDGTLYVNGKELEDLSGSIKNLLVG